MLEIAVLPADYPALLALRPDLAPNECPAIVPDRRELAVVCASIRHYMVRVPQGGPAYWRYTAPVKKGFFRRSLNITAQQEAWFVLFARPCPSHARVRLLPKRRAVSLAPR